MDLEQNIYNVIISSELPIKICNKSDIIKNFGDDVSGISMCCTDEKKLLLICCNKNNFYSQIEIMTHFAYSCNVIQHIMPHLKITKLWITMRKPDSAETAVGKRCDFQCILSHNMQELVNETKKYVVNFFVDSFRVITESEDAMM